MVDWQLLAIVGFSVAGGLLLTLAVVIAFCMRRYRYAHQHYHAEVAQLEENLKVVKRENAAKEEAVCTLRRSVADFDSEKSLLLKRLENCDKLSTPEEVRSCLRELQIYLAVQAANASAIHQAVDMQFERGPPALLAEVWLIHGETRKARDESSHPAFDELNRPFSTLKRTDCTCEWKHKSAYEDGMTTSTGPSRCMRQLPPLREFHSCAVHCAVPPCRRKPPMHPSNSPVTAQQMNISSCFQTGTCAFSETGGACYAETSAVHAECQPTEEAFTRNWGATRSSAENEITECPCSTERCNRAVTPVIEGSSACQASGLGTTMGDTELSRISNCTATKDCCNTAIIPAHTFAPEYIFVAEQWLPGPSETTKTSCHRVPLVRLTKFSRRDHSKNISLENELYQQVFPDAHKFEKVLISSKGTRKCSLVSSNRDHVKLQSRALASVLPSLSVSTRTLAFPHLCYSLVEYKFEQLNSISKRSLRRYIGDTLHQPLSLVVRIFERKSLPGATPAASPTNKEEDRMITEEEQESWRLLYETPPIALTEAEGRIVDDNSVEFDGHASFQYKHTYTLSRPVLGDQPSLARPGSLRGSSLSPLHKEDGKAAPCTTQTAECRSLAYDSLAETTALPASHPARRPSFGCTLTREEMTTRHMRNEFPTIIIGKRPVRGECDRGCISQVIEVPSFPRVRGASPGGSLPEGCGVVTSFNADEGQETYNRSPRGGNDLLKASSCERLMSSASMLRSPSHGAEPGAASAARFKNVCLKQQGQIYEDEVFSVSCVIGTTIIPSENVLHASIELSIVNQKYAAASSPPSTLGILETSDASCITGFHSVHTTVENVERDALSCSVTPIVRVPPAGPHSPARVCQTISASVTQPFQFVPEVTLRVVLLDGSERKCVFALPLVIAHFMKPLELLPASFMQLWFDGTLHPRRLSVRISTLIKAEGPKELVKVVTLNGKLAIVKGVKHPLAEGSIFAIGELAAIGDMVGESKCLVRLWQSHHASSPMAKLEVKTEHRRLLDAVSELLAYLLQDSE